MASVIELDCTAELVGLRYGPVQYSAEAMNCMVSMLNLLSKGPGVVWPNAMKKIQVHLFGWLKNIQKLTPVALLIILMLLFSCGEIWTSSCTGFRLSR